MSCLPIPGYEKWEVFVTEMRHRLLYDDSFGAFWYLAWKDVVSNSGHDTAEKYAVLWHAKDLLLYVLTSS